MVGGHREGGVCLDATLRREFEEEIGVTPTAFSELAALTEPAPEINGSDAYDGYAITAWRGPGPPCGVTSMWKSAGSPRPRRSRSTLRSRNSGTC